MDNILKKKVFFMSTHFTEPASNLWQIISKSPIQFTAAI